MSEFNAGTTVDGRYRVLSRLGAGGMADVYLARDEQLDRDVAVKLLHRRFAEDQAFVERFRREAQAAASLQHPNVVSIFDRGAYDGTYYIAMEYLQGRTLKQVVREEAPLEVGRAIDIALQMLKAARFAHRRGVIHRDLKPHNVMVDDNGHVKVTDFGIARAGASDMTETGSIMGTAQYLSPEQAQGLAVSAPSDLYSIAIVLYEMLTGRVPFDGELPVSIALKHVSEAPMPPSQVNPAIPSALEQVVLWALNKNPADRPADADQFIAALEQVRDALAQTPGEVTASMQAVRAGAAGLPPAVGYQYAPGGMLGAGALGAYDAAGGGGGFGPHQLDRYDDDGGGGKGTPVWPWIVGLVVVLLLAGGGVAAYLLTRPKHATVPNVVNLNLATAQQRIQSAGFSPIESNVNSAQPKDTIIRQSPAPNASAKQGSTVILTVSAGRQQITIPIVQGESRNKAVRALNKAGLRVGSTRREASQTVAAGDATRTAPDGGSTVSKGSPVTLYLSSGLQVPSVVGQQWTDAEGQLGQFNVTTTPQTTTTATPGTVVAQTPRANQPAGKDGAVTLTIAQAPTHLQVPNVIGESRVQASSALNKAGFTVVIQHKSVSDASLVGTVIKQNPAGNATAKQNATVTITLGKLQINTAPTITVPPPTEPAPPPSTPPPLLP